MAFLLPILDLGDTVKGGSITVNCSDYHIKAKVEPKTIMVFSGHAPNYIYIEMPDNIAFYMILHSNSPTSGQTSVA